MVYKRVQKNTSSSGPAYTKGASESKFRQTSFGIHQPTADADSNPQEIPSYSQKPHEYGSTNILSRVIETLQRQQAAEKSQLQPEPKADDASNEAVALQRQSESPDLGDEDDNSTKGETIQRSCSECQSELPVEPLESEISPQSATIQRQNTPAAPEFNQIASIQTKLTIGAPGDMYEQEADSMAERVMSMDAPAANSQPIQRQNEETQENIQRQPLAASITPLIQRFTKTVQTKGEGGATPATPDLESRLTNQKGGGTPLDKETRSFMEPRFGSDLSQVRVHTDSTAVQMNKELGAQAFTHGNDIFYGAGKTPGQNALTAHELTHTIQQTGGVQLRRQPEKDNKQPRLSQKYPHTIQNKLTTGIQPRIQRKTDPGQILEQLKNTPPSNAATAYDTAQANSATAWSEQKQELEASIPQIPAPTGLPAKDAGVKQAPQTAGKADTNKEPLLPGGKKEPVAPNSPTQSDATVQIAPPHPITPTQIAGGNTAKTGEIADSKPDPQIAASAQNALNSVNLDSSQISTQAGTPPTVNLADAAINPAQLDSEQQQANQQVQQEKAKSAQEINKDFGENDIFPKSSDETLKANKQLTLAQVAGAKAEKAPTIPPEIVANLDQSLAPQFQERIGGEQEKYTVGKNKFDQDAAKSRTDADKEIEKLNQDTSQQQLESQKQAQSDVQAARLEWQTELDNADKDYQEKAGLATTTQKGKIDAEKLKGDAAASKHLADAEKEAEQKKQAAETEAQQKKDEGQKESGGFLGWLADKATAFIDGIKQAVNFIFDKLREGIKFIFEAAKKLAIAAIELAQKAITTLIQAFGEILKGIVNLVFAAFPEIAKRINSKIDQAVNTAVQAVNTAADLLKKGVAAALDFLANTLDSLLGIIQSLYNAVLGGIGAIIKGAIEIIRRLGNLVEAAKQMPNQFMGQLSEEVLGMDLSQPLAFERSAATCAKQDMPAMAQGDKATAATGGDASALLQKDKFTENDIAVDQVAPMDVSPEFLASLKLPEGGEVAFGESNDPANSMEAIKAELGGGQLEPSQAQKNAAPGEQAVGGCCDDEQATEAKLQELMNQKPEGAQGTQKQGEPAKQGDIPESMKTVGPLTAGQRARYMANQMIQGVKQWFSANWPALLAGAIAALAAFIGLNILTGGAIMAAVPPLLQVVGTVMTGVALANIAGHIGSYLSQGWAGAIPGAAKSLARGLAAGAVELVFALLFNMGAVIKALKGGVKGTTKAVVNSVKDTVKTTLKSVKELGQIAKTGAKTALKNGKIMLGGVKGGFAKGAKSLDDLASRLVNKLRFKKFKVRRQGGRIQLWGEINPWILLADGSIEKVSFEGQGRKQIGDQVKHNGQDAIVVGIRNQESAVVKELQQELPEFRNATYNAFGNEGLRNLATKAKKLPKTTDDWIKWAAENSDKVKGLNVQGIVEEYGKHYPEAVNKFLNGWFSGKYTRNLSNSGHVGDLSSLGIPKDVLKNIANDSELKELALMLRPSNAAHATPTRQITLPKPGTATINVPQGTSMRIKDIAKNAGPSPNPKTGFLEVKIKIDGEYKTFAFVEGDNGTIRLLPGEQARGLTPANLDKLKSNTDIIPLPEGNVTTSISSMYTPPVSTGLGDPKRGLVGTSLYRDGQEIKYLAVSPDQGKTYYLEEAKKLLDEQGNLRTDLNVTVVGSDIDLLAVLSRNGELNKIADVNELASKHPEMFNALLEAFSTNRKNVNSLTKEGATFKFPSAASDIQHGPQIPFLEDKLLQNATAGLVKPEQLKQMSRQKLQRYISQYRKKIGEPNFKQEVEKILGISDGRTIVTIKGKNYTIPLRDVPMLYKLLGHEFPVAAYLPL